MLDMVPLNARDEKGYVLCSDEMYFQRCNGESTKEPLCHLTKAFSFSTASFVRHRNYGEIV